MPPELTLEVLNQYGSSSLLITMNQCNVLLDPSEVDALIGELITYRTEMQPQVSTSPSRTHKYVIESAPSWHIEGNQRFDGAVIFFRHSGLGWTGFAIPRASLARLTHALSTCAGERCHEGVIS